MQYYKGFQRFELSEGWTVVIIQLSLGDSS